MLGLICIALLCHVLRSILLPFVIAGILAFLLTPLIDHVAARTRMPRPLVALTPLGPLLAAIAVGIILGGPALAHAVTHVASNIRGTLGGLLGEFMGSRTLPIAGRSLDAQQLADAAVGYGAHWLTTSASLPRIVMHGAGAVVMAGLTFVVLGYCLIDGPQLARGLLWLTPPRHRPFVQEMWRRLAPLLRRYFVGVALVVLYATVAAYLGLGLVLRLKGALFLAIITGALEMLPIIGPTASALIAGLAAVQQAKSGSSIMAYVVYVVALRSSIDHFFGPLVLGGAARVRPVLVIFGFLAGGLLLGISGVILAVPVILAIRVSLGILYEGSGAEGRAGELPSKAKAMAQR